MYKYKLQNLLMVFKTGLIQNTTYGGPQTTGFTCGLKLDYLIIFTF